VDRVAKGDLGAHGSRKIEEKFPVIASEAKQSMLVRCGAEWIASSLGLLAMTAT